MLSTGRASIAGGIAGVGHGLVFVGFLQPWVAGQFGARDRLSGLDLVRITDGLIDHGLASDVLTLPITRVLLFAVPVAAANALLLLVLARVGLMERAHARHLVSALALPTAFVVIVAHALLILAARGDSVIDGPAFGLIVTTAGALLAAGSWAIERGPSPVAAPPIGAPASSAAEHAAPEA
jgi:hypothetical protein